MKTLYRKEEHWLRDGEFQYRARFNRYHRPIRTFPELRDNEAIAADLHDDPDYMGFERLRARGSRTMRFLDCWNDFNRARNNGKSWKDYTKQPKQYMMAFEPGTQPRKKSTLELRLERMIDNLS